MLKHLLVLGAFFSAVSALAAAQATVRVEPSHLQGPRPLQEQTASAAVRDYLQAWQSMRAALDRNRADLLDRDFVGTARDKLADTIRQQASLGLRTVYQDRAHDIQIVFYSPEGLSIQLTDRIEYDMQIVDRDQVKSTQHVSARYIVVLTPTEVRWTVRVFQAESE